MPGGRRMTMRLDKFTIKAQEALGDAQQLASEQGNSRIEPEHLLLVLAEQVDGVVRAILARAGARPPEIVASVRQEIARFPKVSGASQAQASPSLSAVLSGADRAASTMKDEFISTEHLLLALADEGSGAAGRVLRENGVTGTLSCARSPTFGAISASPIRTRRRSIRLSSDMAATSLTRHGSRSSTRSSDGMTRSGAWCRC